MREPIPPFHLTKELRTVFKENVGDLYRDPGLHRLIEVLKITEHPIATVGDTTTLNLVGSGIVPDLAIVDLGTRRGDLSDRDGQRMMDFLETGNVTEIVNPQERITDELWNAIGSFYGNFYRNPSTDHEDNAQGSSSDHRNKFKIGRPERMGTAPVIIRIIGEEDLASLPCVYFAKNGGHVLYGLPDEGLIHIQVDDIHRNIVRDALMKMEALNESQDRQSDR